MSQTDLTGSRLSPQQRRLWLLHGRRCDSCRASILLEIEGELDEMRLRRAVQRSIDRHEILRTTFPGRSGILFPVQHIAASELAWERLAALPPRLPSGRPRAVDPASGPVLRAAWAPLGECRTGLLISCPSLCADASSLALLAEEVAAHAGGGSLAEHTMQYADFAEWYSELLESDDPEIREGSAFWSRIDLEPLASMRLPGERSRPVAELRVEGLPLDFEEGTASRVTAVANRLGASLEEFLLTCWRILLARLVPGPGPVLPVGCMAPGRSYEDLIGAVGPFARCLPVAVAVHGHQRFSQVLTQICSALREGREREESGLLPESDKVGEVMSFPAVFEHLAVPAAATVRGVSVSVCDWSVLAEPFKVKLSSTELALGWRCRLEYDSASLSNTAVRRLAAALQRVVTAMAIDPEARVDYLDLLGAAECHRLSVELNHTAPAAPPELIHQRITAALVAAPPEQPAVIDSDGELRHRELEQRASRLAHHLRRHGIGPEVPVALLLGRSVDMLVGLLATLKSGGAYLPLEPGLPPARIRRLVAASGAGAVLTREPWRRDLPDLRVPVIDLEADRQAIDSESDWPPPEVSPPEVSPPEVSPDNLAYVLFTSGSTGDPKAVAITHRNLIGYLNAALSLSALPAGGRYAMVSSVAADLGNTAIYPALATGGCLYLVGEDTLGDPQALAELLAEHAIDVVKIVPSHLEALAAAGGIRRFLSRRALVLGGEAFSRKLAERLLEASGSGVEVYNHYGPTEATVGATAHRLTTVPESPTVPIGRPLAAAEAHVLDPWLRPLSTGVAGELFLGGFGLARGYLGAPAATAERFVPRPGARPGARLYRTGDRAWRWPDGELEFLGRADHQVKVRGFRVELGEIEAALAHFPGVRESVVAVREDQPGDHRLVAYLVMEKGQEPTADELRSLLGDSLPGHMVPSAFVFLEALPLNRNGKVDRRGLPAPEAAGRDRTVPYVAPQNPVERELAEVWSQVLGVDQVGIEDNFFELGGDSILVIQVVAHAHRRGLKLTPRQFFEHRTLAELAAVVEVSAARAAHCGPVRGEVPLTPIQRWFFAREFPDPHHWNQAILLELQESFELAHWATALAYLERHHDALRMRFTKTDGEWRQSYGEPTPLLSVFDLSALPEARRPAAAVAAAAAAQARLDLEVGPLFRHGFFRFGTGEQDRLLFVIHHLVVDGVSWRILLEDLGSALRALAAGEKPCLPPKSSSFQEWSRRLQDHARRDLPADEVDFWLAGPEIAAAPLPVDFEGGGNTLAAARSVRVELSEEETAALLKEVPSAYRTQVNDVLLTALVLAFAPWIGRRSLLVELEGHGREDLFAEIDLSRTVGWFTSHFPVHLDLGEGGDLGDELLRIKEILRRVPGRGLGYGLLRYLRTEPEVVEGLARWHRPEVGFNYLGQFEGTFSSSAPWIPARERAGATKSPRVERRCLIEVVSRVASGRLEASFRYSTHRHRRETIADLAERYGDALRSLIDHCTSASTDGGFSPSDFPLVELSQEQLERLARKVDQAGGSR